ncbi:hypothetical protein HPB50_027221 [Hyalomma asiaticum]|uniref:Uncharacterized protein n=1 Tax=Hyalomma asiaticum TaxID=266040 RepID=A0ACB7TPV8_HYAAI|nr:hypothetical protein HPB50_027221 [Hyalomma asiaticum]
MVDKKKKQHEVHDQLLHVRQHRLARLVGHGDGQAGLFCLCRSPPVILAGNEAKAPTAGTRKAKRTATGCGHCRTQPPASSSCASEGSPVYSEWYMESGGCS